MTKHEKPLKQTNIRHLLHHMPPDREWRFNGSISIKVQDDYMLSDQERSLIGRISGASSFAIERRKGSLFISPLGEHYPSLPVPYHESRVFDAQDGIHLRTTYAGHAADVRFHELAHAGTVYMARTSHRQGQNK